MTDLTTYCLSKEQCTDVQAILCHFMYGVSKSFYVWSKQSEEEQGFFQALVNTGSNPHVN